MHESPSACVYAVALPVPLRKTFDYLALEHGSRAEVGCRVSVLFGKQRLVGIVTEVRGHSELPLQQLKAVEKVLDKKPLLGAQLLRLYRWTASYYQHPLGEVLSTALPVLLRQGETAELSQESAWSFTPQGQQINQDELKRAPKQQALLLQLRQLYSDTTTLLWHKDLLNLGIKRPQLQALADKGLLLEQQLSPAEQTNTASSDELLKQSPLSLHHEQQQALDQIQLDSFACYLLYGTTGSGKTEVYLQAIEKVLRQGKQALVLIPEIGLTPQTLQRFQQRFSCPMAILHSSLNDTERKQAWLMAAKGLADIVIGTRSAIFTPLPRAGLIIIDEEHDNSFKQQDGLRYSARDLAAVRCQQAGIPLLLGSATPSLESYHNSQSQRYRLLSLTHRAGGAIEPQIQMIDLRQQALREGFSEQLLQEISQHLERGDQVLVFLNRRGFAPTLMCHNCGWLAQCPACDARLTVHQHPHHLHCHHCDHQRPVPTQCPTCRSYELQHLGQGTERAEQLLQQHFSNFPVIRVDRDSTRRKHAMQDIFTQVHTGEPCILVGTQMLAKGHHFPDVTLVALLDVDSGLFSIDFRGPEKMGQLLLQVAGRAGRAHKPGKVIIQSHLCDHPLLQTLLHQGYSPYAQLLLDERRAALLPPFTFMALLRAESKRPELAHQLMQQARTLASSLLASTPLASTSLASTPGQHTQAPCQLLGPLPAPMEKRNERYRYQLQITSSHRPQLQQLLSQLIPQIEASPLAKRARWSVDVDPQDMN